MAFAEYFNRNAMAASQLLNNYNNSGFEAILNRQCIGLAIDAKAASAREGLASADLVIRIISRLYPRIAIIALEKSAQETRNSLSELAKSINPKIDIAKSLNSVTHCLVIGRSEIKLARKNGRVFYIGSRGWTAIISASKPVGSSSTRNPFGAGAAACIGCANIFNTVFDKQLDDVTTDNRDVRLSISQLVSGKAIRPNNESKISDIGNVHLVGCGAIGNGALWALKRSYAKGILTIIDPESIELSNLQRYVLAEYDDVDRGKAMLATQWLQGNSKLNTIYQKYSWEEYVKHSDWKFDCVLVAVDSAKSRISIQASLPRYIINSWTLGSAVGVSRHMFIGDQACLACMYLPNEVVKNEDQIIANALGFATEAPHPELMDIRRRLDLNVPTERAFLEVIASRKGQLLSELLPFENRPLRTLYSEGVCGGRVLGLMVKGKETTAEVPMPFQSAFAGILLAAEAILRASEKRYNTIGTVTRIDLLKRLPPILSTPRGKDIYGRCICQDADFIKVYREKYDTND